MNGSIVKTTSHLKRDSDTMQHGELRSYRGSRLVKEFFLQFSSFNFNDTSKQERHCSTSSSSSSSSPTAATSSDSETRERDDQSETDSPPVLVSSSNVDDRTVKPVVCRETNHEQAQANQKFPKTNQKDTMIERRNPLFADSGRASSEIPEWLQKFREIWWMMEFLNTETHTTVLLMKYL